MNWGNFQTHNEAPTRAFEILCNQLFENWCKDFYENELKSFFVVNGSGGDGGVESYAELKSDKIIGLQAKWFPDSISNSQMTQIKKSIITALKVRPNISNYIVCVPRDLANKTAKSGKSEIERWKKVKDEMLKEHPELTIELWTESHLLKELQKDSSAGIYKFWFDKVEISEETIKHSFEKSKSSWLKQKYVPDLNSFGSIYDNIYKHLGEINQTKNIISFFEKIDDLCMNFIFASDDLIDVCCKDNKKLETFIIDVKDKMFNMREESLKIIDKLKNESIYGFSVDEKIFNIDFQEILEELNSHKENHSYYFHFDNANKILKKLDNISFYSILDQLEEKNNKKNLIFMGEPGTGKTHGIAAIAEKMLCSDYHIPILIQGSNITLTSTWKDVIISSLGLSNSWSEDEIWQGLLSIVNRRRIKNLDKYNDVSILPKVLIAVDGIDETSLSEKWVELAKESCAIRKKYPLINFCFLSRPYVFDNKLIDAKKIYISVTGDVPVYQLFEQYISNYNIDITNAKWVKYALTTPFTLKLFCELNCNKKIGYQSGIDLSLSSLLKEKIHMIEIEYCKKELNGNIANQYIFKTIIFLSSMFQSKSRLERDEVINKLALELNINSTQSQKILSYLENYGILRLYCERSSNFLSPDSYFYYSGIQGYFDYATALMLINKYSEPANISFCNCKSLTNNSYYILAIVLIREYNYLITDNNTIDMAISPEFKNALLLFALRHSNMIDAFKYRERVMDMMKKDSETLTNIINSIILPLSREKNHALGVSLFDEFMVSFKTPAERDIIWSIPCFLKNSKGQKWFSSTECHLGEETYCLLDSDSFEGLPTLYAWGLSTVDNNKRRIYRKEIMKWALMVPNEFYNIFLKFAFSDDPQIRSDIFSILMSLLYEINDMHLLKIATQWLMKNILSPEKIDDNRDIAIRYYSISILRRAVYLGLIDKKKAIPYLPPYIIDNKKIPLNKDAFSGTRMGGYSGITYDLSRYVLIDHITSNFSDYSNKINGQIDNLISDIVAACDDVERLDFGKFIISAAFEFITRHGWNESDFLKKDGKYNGVDSAIHQTHWPSTHGSQSPIMTICEKYIWQARNYIEGFLSDRLLYIDSEDKAVHLDDYGLLEDFIVPALELNEINPDNRRDLYPWYIPIKNSVKNNNKPKTAEDVINSIKSSEKIKWTDWINLDNKKNIYPISNNKLIALNGYSCFENSLGYEMNIFISSLLIDRNSTADFINKIKNDSELAKQISNPTDWVGGYFSDCYITPKEICWMPWKKRYDCSRINEFSDLKISSAADECTYNFIDYGDVSYKLPSREIRDILSIHNTDGYCFFDSNANIKAINVFNGEKWKTQQNYLLVDKKLLSLVSKKGKRIIWILRELYRENVFSREKFKGLYAENDSSYIGYFEKNKFVIEKIHFNEQYRIDSEIL